MTRASLLITLTPLTFLGCTMSKPAPKPVTLAVVNAKVWTGDLRQPWAEAIAVSGEELAAVGLGSEIRKLLGSETQVIDAKGQTVMPAEQRKGILEPGKLADFVILDRDLTQVDPETIRDAKVVMTVVGGKVVYEGDR
jgi:predicted amidohydrolase YtcJ